MRRIVSAVCVCAIAAVPTLQAQTPLVSPLPVRRVVLYKNGVGYFEHVGRVRGTQTVTIDFNSAQLNDVLKSLTTLDLGEGRIGHVSFNSEAPFSQRLGDLSLPIREGTTLFDLLGALRGARLEARTGGRVITGRVLGIERRQRGKDDATRDELSLVSDAGEIRSIELTPAVRLRLLDRDLAARVEAYLGLLASNRAQDRRRMSISAIGSGERDVLVSYVSEVPIWKTTYRIVLPRGHGKPLLQGWAIVDNTVGEDWTNVELSLVAGAPQSFVQQLAQPLYVHRPVVGMPRGVTPMPQIHQETLSEAVTVNAPPPPPAMPSAAPGSAGAVGPGHAGGVVGRLEAQRSLAERTELEHRLANIQASAAGQNLGDLFEYRVAEPITIPKNQSALVPILKAEVSLDRVSLWNDRIGAARPLRALWLTNSSGLTLDAGSFMVLEDATFAGEGLLEPLKPGEKRLLSYAIDLGVQVESGNGDDVQRISHVRFDRGVVVQQSEHRSRRVYTIRNSDVSDRTVVIEHPIRPGWTLVKGPEPAETSLTTYRFTIPVAAKRGATLAVDERRPIETRYAISELTDEQIGVFVRGGQETAAVAQALGPIQATKALIASLAADIEARNGTVNTISADQTRLRENMRSLKGSGAEQQLLKRYVAQLNEQEDRLTTMRRELDDLAQKLERAKTDLAQKIEALSLDVTIDDGR